MRPARIILILVALVAGSLAAFLVTRGGRPPAEPSQVVTQVVPEEKAQVLVARAPIGVGERLTVDNLEWQDWPEGALRSEYVTVSAMPDAVTELSGAVVRFEFFPGEPIRQAKLVRSDQGYLSAVLSPGKRGVSIEVAAESSAGGFIVPNDYVDVLLTTQSDMGLRSEVVLSDAKVMAIGKRLGELGESGGGGADSDGAPAPETFDGKTIATLELNPAQAETLVNASMRGELSLALRSVADFNRQSGPATGNQAVRLIRYGREQSVLASGVDPASSEWGGDDISMPINVQ
jgi:pilus assembly protein CpaB